MSNWDSNGTPAQDTLPWPAHPGDDHLPAPAWTYSHSPATGEAIAYYPGRVEAETIDPGESIGSGALVRRSGATLASVDITSGTLQTGVVLNESTGYRLQLWDQTRCMGQFAFETVNSIVDFQTEGNGIRFPGAGWIYSSSGGSIVIRRRSGNGPIAVEDNNGTSRRNLVTEAGAAFQGNVAIVAPSNDPGPGGQTPYQTFTQADGTPYARTFAQKTADGIGIWGLECATNGSMQLGAHVSGTQSPPQFYIYGELSAQVLTQRSARVDKMHIAPVLGREVKEAWQALNPSRFFWKGLRERTDNRRKFGFTADDMPAELTTLDGSGYDLAQVLAVTVARVKQLEAELKRVTERSHPWRWLRRAA